MRLAAPSSILTFCMQQAVQMFTRPAHQLAVLRTEHASAAVWKYCAGGRWVKQLDEGERVGDGSVKRIDYDQVWKLDRGMVRGAISG